MAALGAAADFAAGEASGSDSGFFTFGGGLVERAAFGFASEFTLLAAASSLSVAASGVSVGCVFFFGVTSSSATGFLLVFVCAAAGRTVANASKLTTI